MSDFRYLDYEGLATYTEQIKNYADSKIVYISDESEIPNPPKEGTLYVIGSNILRDEEIIIGTQTASTSSWIGQSIDTRLYDGKRIAYYLPYPSIFGVPSTLTLRLNGEANTTTPAIRIISEGGYFNNVIPGGSVIRMTYFENIMMNGDMRGGWICDGNVVQNNITGSGTNNCIAKFDGTNTITNGPTFDRETTKYLRHDGEWAVPYTHPTTSGNKHIPAGGKINQYLKYDSDGTAIWVDPECQIINYGELVNGLSSTIMPSEVTLSDSVFLENGRRLVVVFHASRGYAGGSLQKLIVNNSIYINLTACDDSSCLLGYTNYRPGVHVLDMILYQNQGTWEGHLMGYSVPKANHANHANSADNVSYGNVVYCECSTNADVTNKIVTSVSSANFNLHTGAVIYVKFSQSNTNPIIALNVNNSGNKTVRYRSVVYESTRVPQYPSWVAGDIIQFVYTGTYWDLVCPTITMRTTSVN